MGGVEGHAMTDAPPTPTPRPMIADIVRDAGVVGGDASGPSMADFAGIGALVGASAASLAASTVIGQAILDRFHIHADDDVAHVFSAPYATAAKALVLALHAQNVHVVSAFDTPGGAAIEAKTPTALLHAAASLMLLVVDSSPATTTVTGHASMQQLRDWGANKRILNDLFAKADEYIKLLAT